MKKFPVLTLAASFALAGFLTSCSEDTVAPAPQPPGGGGDSTSMSVGPGESDANDYVVVATTSDVNSIVQTRTLNSGSVTSVNNGVQTGSGTNWVFWGNKYLYRLQYNQGNAGVTSSYRMNANGQVEERDVQYNITRFVTYGVWGENVITASAVETDDTVHSNVYLDDEPVYAKGLGIVYLNAEEETKTDKTVPCENFLGNGEYVTLAGIVEANGKLYTSVVPMGMSQYGVAKYYGNTESDGPYVKYPDLIKTESGGSNSSSYKAGELQWTQYPDEAWVAIYDDDSFENPTLIRTDRISYACGRFKSQYYQTIWPASNGDIYVFSPSYAKSMSDPRQQTSLPSGVVRIKAGEKQFDPTFYFNIEEASGGLQMYRCWPISDDWFLLQMYNTSDLSSSGARTRLAVFKGGDNPTFAFVDGMPSDDVISSIGTTPYAENGVAWIPVVTSDGQQPALYRIDAATATATRGLEVEASSVSAVGRLKAAN